MTGDTVVRRLRPYLFTSYRRVAVPQVYSRRFAAGAIRYDGSGKDREVTNDYQKRVRRLESAFGGHDDHNAWYGRLSDRSPRRLSLKEFRAKYNGLSDGEAAHEVEAVAGRVQTVRRVSSKLVFVTIKHGSDTLQVIVQANKLELDSAQPPAPDGKVVPDPVAAVKLFATTARKGDSVEVEGVPYRSETGELSIRASRSPRQLSWSLHQIPDTLDDPETRAKNRHVDMLVNPSVVQTMRVRHLVEKSIRDFFDQDGFTSVQTPILTAGAGGAIARPFKTEATELEGQQLDLRIAPELWLKRLIVGGLEKVYELGPAFRNEGVDATHNPEFYICEFYESFATLVDLMTKTEKLLAYISSNLSMSRQEEVLDSLPPPLTLEEPYKRLRFVPDLENQLGEGLPDLPPEGDEEGAHQKLLAILKAKDISLPSKPTLPRLLDALSAKYLEPLCTKPTFITEHPACMSPLAKHLRCPETGQMVSARAELFIDSREIANMYEEENSSFEQRKKFVDQLEYREVDGEGDSTIDESYLEALEWGLPPTGGWGCGVDRLVMLFSGRERLGDVLSFGGLRNVVGVGRGRR